MSNTPSDAEIDEVTLDVLGYAALDKETNETARMIARAVLAKWGSPQPVVREPLTDEQLAEMMRDTWGCASIAPRHALQFARAVEAEVRQQDDELIRQMLEVLEYVRNTPEAEYDSKAALSKAQAAITAARARLGEKT